MASFLLTNIHPKFIDYMPASIITPRNLPGVKIGDSYISIGNATAIHHPDRIMLVHAFYIDSPEHTFGRLFSLHEIEENKVIAAFIRQLLADNFGPHLTEWINQHRPELETAYNELCPAN